MAWGQRVKLSDDMRRVWIVKILRVNSRVEKFKFLKSKSGFCHEWLIKLKQVDIIVNIFIWYLINITKKINFIKKEYYGHQPTLRKPWHNFLKVLCFKPPMIQQKRTGMFCFSEVFTYCLLNFAKNLDSNPKRHDWGKQILNWPAKKS